MANLTLTRNIDLVTDRCYECGRWYAYERQGPGNPRQCSRCVDKWWRSAQAANEARNKTIAALRGVVTKLKKQLETRK